MDAQEIRMRCLEVAQASVRTAVASDPTYVITVAAKFEAFVVGDGKASKAAKAKEPPA